MGRSLRALVAAAGLCEGCRCWHRARLLCYKISMELPPGGTASHEIRVPVGIAAKLDAGAEVTVHYDPIERICRGRFSRKAVVYLDGVMTGVVTVEWEEAENWLLALARSFGLFDRNRKPGIERDLSLVRSP